MPPEPDAIGAALEPPSRGRQNERLLIGGVLAYSLLVVVLMVVRGVEITPDVMVVAFGLVAVILGRTKLFLRDWIPFVALLLAYELMRGLAAKVGFAVHVLGMVSAERTLSFGLLPPAVLQAALRPATGPDHVAELATIVYMLHFALPLVTGFLLWVWRRERYYDFIAALILLSLTAFATFLLIPSAPPWYAAMQGVVNGPTGAPEISYLKPAAFERIASALGFAGHYFYSYVFYGVNPNEFAAWPSLHVGYPFLTFLVLRRAFGRIAWLAFGYTLLVAFSVMYTGDHWLIDCIAGVAFAYIAYYVAIRAAIFRRLAARIPRPRLAARPAREPQPPTA